MGDGLLGRLRQSVSAGLTARRDGRRGGPRAGTAASPGPAATATGGITISYAPEHDGDADPGEIVWAWVPYEDDPTQGKDRPVLVLGHDGPLLSGVQLSSRDRRSLHDGDDWVPVGTGDWDRERRPSYVDASRLLKLHPADVRREGAALDREAFDRVLGRVATLHDWADHR